MNTKVLSTLGVIVALLTAWLVITMLNTPKVSVQGPTEEVTLMYPSSKSGSVKRPSTRSNVMTSASVAEHDVKTVVKVK